MPNRLARSTSPYLQQHAENPVDWYEWGEEAFAAARSRDVPILLSVGYSACHWCHVMAHESFEDDETAAQMNAQFVNVKVDREERPDVDAVYMEAVQATTGRGGWPMTVWLTPDGHPFHAGTYFPRDDRHGMPSFRRVMDAVSETWIHQRDEIERRSRTIVDAISRTLPAGEKLPGQAELEAAYRNLESAFDPVNGGFGGAPKFPQQPVLDFLLRIAHEPWAPRAAEMVSTTLVRMARGGIYDQVGGGFARYSVDGVWLIPHFEKMLYDNAQLARLYLWAWRELGVEQFRTIAVETIDYLLRDLRHPDGAYYSAEDADSEGEEGKFYVWSRSEFLDVAGPTDGPIAAEVFGVTDDGNFEGANTLFVANRFSEVARRRGTTTEEVATAVERTRLRLFERRSHRVRPGLDHKVVASWNGLMVRSLAEAGSVLERPDLIEHARSCARFLLREMRAGDGRMLRTWSKGVAKTPGFLEDHAATALGLFTLYAATGETEWFEAASQLTRLIPELFADPAGGFFTTARDAEALVKRPKDQLDNPSPSGNSLAAEALLMLSLYTGDDEARRHVDDTIASGVLLLDRYPSAVGHLAGVIHSIVRGPLEVAITGPNAPELATVVWRRYRPHVALAVADTTPPAIAIPLLESRYGETTRAFVCQGFVCDLPVSTPEDLERALG